jgi:hypothetical protein
MGFGGIMSVFFNVVGRFIEQTGGVCTFLYKVRDGLIRDDKEQFSEAAMRDVRDYSVK